ncbi:MAG: bifunctional (p)ppGpp synthetase/guanosine-3',5'-bis(diphosphate) 3'-pyrophosphohydrolase [Clostridiales bacterium]|nr:bifunctional (p)ppGpp synthetase/guanosine-3',5'-bis(diphosphate) 3'-pyrophosphohydrolase [Clostridiales bacterium]
MSKQFNELIETIKSYNPNSNIELITEAYLFAKKAHEGQMRASNEPFISHPVNVAKILANLELNSKTIAAGILHDVIEDTEATYDQVKEKFGSEIATMVDGVSKLSLINLDTKKEQQVENIRKMLLAMTKDIRVIIIKLSDRLHNMRTLEYVTREKQIFKATETLEIYAPIAHRLGMSSFKWELEDISFHYLHPDEYYKLVKQISSKRKEREAYIDSIKEAISNNLDKKNIKATVEGRVKHLFSIYNKMNKQEKSIDQIYDLFALRIIVDSVNDCYAVLGFIHDMYKPMPGRFKDYISMPKNNRYQSLHTTVIGSKGQPFEVQIRSKEMHHIAELGIAAHWKYKQGVKSKEDMESKLAWLRQLVEWQSDTSDADEFYDTLKVDLFNDEVFVFTPKGDVKSLPAGSTSIDFAYYIHSAVGNKMTGAKINNKMEPLSTILENGDIVEIITSASSKGPSRDWLKIAASPSAKNKIRQFFKKENREENIEKGKEMVERELKRQRLVYSEIFNPKYYDETIRKYNFKTLDDAFCAIGYAGITANKIISRLKEEYRKDHLGDIPIEELIVPKKEHVPIGNEQGIIVKGINNCLVKISQCCTPVPGDDIVGYITRGRGVTIHRKDCINIINDKGFEERQIEVSWAKNTDSNYNAEITIKAYDRNNLLGEITNLINDMNVTMRKVEANATSDGVAIIKVMIEITGKDELSKITKKVRRLSGVFEITRKNKRK